MIPTFQEWVNFLEYEAGPGAEAGAPQMPDDQGAQNSQGDAGSALGEPQHSGDEESMNLSTLIERRLEMLLDEIQRKRGMSREQLVVVLSQVMNVLAEKGLKKGQMMQAAGQEEECLVRFLS